LPATNRNERTSWRTAIFVDRYLVGLEIGGELPVSVTDHSLQQYFAGRASDHSVRRLGVWAKPLAISRANGKNTRLIIPVMTHDPELPVRE
jgi:hypothetical protein